MSLQQHNIEEVKGKFYLSAKSRKTATHTKVILPEYLVEILKRYPITRLNLLPQLSLFHFNKSLKEIARLAGWTENLQKKGG